MDILKTVVGVAGAANELFSGGDDDVKRCANCRFWGFPEDPQPRAKEEQRACHFDPLIRASNFKPTALDWCGKHEDK